MFDIFFREDKGDQILDYNQEIQTMEEQLKKLQKEVQRAQPDLYCQIWDALFCYYIFLMRFGHAGRIYHT